MAQILVVDDETTARKAFRSMLESLQYEVLEAVDAEEALRVYRDHQPDLVICDVFLPRKDGLTFLLELRKEDPEARLLLISGNWNRICVDASHVAGHLGAVAVLDKPISLRELRDAVKRGLAHNPTP